MNGLIGWGLSFTLLALGLNIPAQAKAPEAIRVEAVAPQEASTPSTVFYNRTIHTNEQRRHQQLLVSEPVFKWGDVSWLPELATKAGWPEDTHGKLAQIILRESGGCPNRRGGDAVDKNCNITHVTEWNHRSDSGLLQINGVNYNPKRNKWAIACRKLDICTQEPLLDALTNLKVGYLLYEADGWNPWDPCAWGEKYAKRCTKTP